MCNFYSAMRDSCSCISNITMYRGGDTSDTVHCSSFLACGVTGAVGFFALNLFALGASFNMGSSYTIADSVIKYGLYTSGGMLGGGLAGMVTSAVTSEIAITVARWAEKKCTSTHEQSGVLDV